MPPKKGSPSGVRKTVIGQPPCPVSADDRVHVERVDVRPLLAVDLDVTKRSFMSAAVAASSKDSCSITWHQWQAA